MSHSFIQQINIPLEIYGQVNSVWATAIRGGFMEEVGIDLEHQGWERWNLVR